MEQISNSRNKMKKVNLYLRSFKGKLWKPKGQVSLGYLNGSSVRKHLTWTDIHEQARAERTLGPLPPAQLNAVILIKNTAQRNLPALPKPVCHSPVV